MLLFWFAWRFPHYAVNSLPSFYWRFKRGDCSFTRATRFPAPHAHRCRVRTPLLDRLILSTAGRRWLHTPAYCVRSGARISWHFHYTYPARTNVTVATLPLGACRRLSLLPLYISLQFAEGMGHDVCWRGHRSGAACGSYRCRLDDVS